MRWKRKDASSVLAAEQRVHLPRRLGCGVALVVVISSCRPAAKGSVSDVASTPKAASVGTVAPLPPDRADTAPSPSATVPARSDEPDPDAGPRFIDEGRADDASRASGLRVESRTMGGSGVHFTYPHIAFADPRVSHAVDAATQSRLRKERAQYQKDRAEIPACQGNTDPDMCAYPLTCRVVFASERVASLLCSGYADHHGAHPTKVAFAINLAIHAGGVAAVGLADLFTAGSPWRARVRELSKADLQRQLRPTGWPESDMDRVLDEPDFALGTDGLHMVYAAFPYVIGPLEVLIPWAQLPFVSPTGSAAELARRGP